MFAGKPSALSIAGFDPSGGAGLVADVKTFEAMGVYGFSVCTAITIQNESKFERVIWTSIKDIIDQVSILKETSDLRFIKIGLIESLTSLKEVLKWIRINIPSAFITWDPILKASAGFEFHSILDQQLLNGCLNNIDLITPNIPEALNLTNEKDIAAASAKLSKVTNVYLKGGHAMHSRVTDQLTISGTLHTFERDRISTGEKHGSGCVLSAAITAGLAKGRGLIEACEVANEYIHHYLSSSESLLGYHFIPATHG
jgi:hydroxymethylpyrimidine/phosphomethylpyrimidine kinase